MKAIYDLGSPPHTRGTLSFSMYHLQIFGITPAYAGNTYFIDEIIELLKDHPRIRGEHYIYICEIL